jgi:multidrug efflux pump subunit AcrA (membrane-fusion protein)
MPALLRQDRFAGLDVAVDEREARLQLRRQIARLEAELGGLFGDAFGHTEIPHRLEATAAAPRVLDLGELEAVRDRLADRIAEARRTVAERARVEAENQELVERMLAAPQDFKWVRVSREDLGLPGCGHWHSRPRLGPIGMLMGWWRVKISSGCPLAGRLAAVEREVEVSRG